MMPMPVILGLVVISTVLVDVAWTAISVSSGSGPLTGSLTRLVWAATAPLRRRGYHRAATLAGVGTVLSVVGMWFALLLGGWGLVFGGSPDAVVGEAGEPVSAVERVVFAGYSVLTLGNGEFRPEGSMGQLATVLATLTGLTTVTLAVTYLVLVVGAASERRQLAAAIAHLGETPHEIVSNAWTGHDFDRLLDRFESIADRLDELTERHLAFPVIHYFHSPQRTRSAPAMIAALDDAVTLLMYGTAADLGPLRRRLRTIRTSVDDYLHTLHGPFIRPRAAPPTLTLTELEQFGIPITTEEEFAEHLDELTDRRAILAALAADDGHPLG